MQLLLSLINDTEQGCKRTDVPLRFVSLSVRVYSFTNRRFSGSGRKQAGRVNITGFTHLFLHVDPEKQVPFHADYKNRLRIKRGLHYLIATNKVGTAIFTFRYYAELNNLLLDKQERQSQNTISTPTILSCKQFEMTLHWVFRPLQISTYIPLLSIGLLSSRDKKKQVSTKLLNYQSNQFLITFVSVLNFISTHQTTSVPHSFWTPDIMRALDCKRYPIHTACSIDNTHYTAPLIS